MSLIRPLQLSKLCIKHQAIVYTAIRNHWNKDYKPGPFPKTTEERAAIAKKYEVDVADYQPYPDDGSGIGDYPNLPMESAETKDPFYPWDNPELKRNFGEPLHAEADLIGEDRYNVNAKHRTPGWLQLTQFLGVMLGSFGLFFLFEKVKFFPQVTEKQYASSQEKHYTFEKC